MMSEHWCWSGCKANMIPHSHGLVGELSQVRSAVSHVLVNVWASAHVDEQASFFFPNKLYLLCCCYYFLLTFSWISRLRTWEFFSAFPPFSCTTDLTPKRLFHPPFPSIDPLFAPWSGLVWRNKAPAESAFLLQPHSPLFCLHLSNSIYQMLPCFALV